MRRVLVIKTTSMGDLVHTLPAVDDLLHHHPRAQVDWLVETPFAAIAALHPGVSRVICQSWRQWRRALGRRATWRAIADTRRELRAMHYDRVIDFQGLAKSAAWALQARGHRVGYGLGSSREAVASLCYHQRVAVPRGMQAVERNRRLMAAALGLSFDSSRAARFGLSMPAVGPWQPTGQPYAVLMPCASRASKQWPLPLWQEIAGQLRAAGMQLVVLWGTPAEAALAEQLASPHGGLVPPRLSVAACAPLIARASLAVGLDTGFVHLAAAFGLPTVGLYCDHDPRLAGLTGPASGWVFSLGGKGQMPALEDVQLAVDQAVELALYSSSTQRGG